MLPKKQSEATHCDCLALMIYSDAEDSPYIATAYITFAYNELTRCTECGKYRYLHCKSQTECDITPISIVRVIRISGKHPMK